MYKYILFDLDNTLLDDDANRMHSIAKVLDDINRAYTDETLKEFVKKDDEYWKRMAKGDFNKTRPKQMSKEETFIWAGGNRIRYFLNDLNFEEAAMLNSKYMEYMKEHVYPFKESIETLKDLSKNYTLYVITNGPEKVALKKIKVLGNYFKDYISSETVGIMKPHHEFYDAALNKFNLKNKSEILIVGDELDKDIKGANNEGIASVWVNTKNKINTSDINPTYEINNIGKLKDLLKVYTKVK